MKKTDDFQLDPEVARKTKAVALTVGTVAGVASVLGFVAQREQFYFSYLVSFVFFVSLALGALFFVMLQYLTTASWSVVVRRLAETVAANFWLLAALMIPVVMGLPSLYHWTHPGIVAASHALQKKQAYLNVPFFIIRSAGYFALWTLLGRRIYRHSTEQDQTGDTGHARAATKWSAGGLPLLVLSTTFAAFDWLMSLDADWYSTIFGLYFFSGGGVAFIALLILLAVQLRRADTLRQSITREHYQDLGKLLFAYTIFWAYIAFSQYFLIWYANIPEETVWFLHRWEGGWRGVSLLLLTGHFVLPFFLLLCRAAKRNLFVLSTTAVWMLAMHYVDLYWIVMPTLHKHTLHPHWLDLGTFLAVGSAVAYGYFSQLSKHALVPLKDSQLRESFSFENV